MLHRVRANDRASRAYGSFAAWSSRQTRSAAPPSMVGSAARFHVGVMAVREVEAGAATGRAADDLSFGGEHDELSLREHVEGGRGAATR
jgi:hypothetical protein